MTMPKTTIPSILSYCQIRPWRFSTLKKIMRHHKFTWFLPYCNHPGLRIYCFYFYYDDAFNYHHFYRNQIDEGTRYFLLSLLSLLLFTEQGGIFHFYFYPNRLFIYILFYFLLFFSDWFIPSLFTLLLWSHKLGEGRVLSGIHLVTDWRLR